MKGCFFSETTELSLTMPGPSMPHATLAPPAHRWRHPTLNDHALSEPRCVLSPHTLRQTTPLREDTLNFPQKFARQFDGNVVFSRYLATIFAAFVRGRHNAAILAESSRQSSEYRQSSMRPIAGITLDRVSAWLRTKAASSRRPAQCRR